jgi:hypothetical protein
MSWSDFLLNSAFLVRSSPFLTAIFIPTPNSPATPSATKIEPTNPHTKRECEGLSGGRTIPRLHSFNASLCSRTMTRTSIATPITTATVNTHASVSHIPDELSRSVIALSKADMALSKAEASEGRLEATWIKCAKITIVALVFLASVRLRRVGHIS